MHPAGCVGVVQLHRGFLHGQVVVVAHLGLAIDLAAAEDFYIRAFDLRIGRRLGPGAVELLGGPAPLYLLQNEAGSAATEDGDVRDYERHWTPLHLDWVVDDIEAALVRAVAAGATLEQSVRGRRWGRIAVLADRSYIYGLSNILFRILVLALKCLI